MYRHAAFSIGGIAMRVFGIAALFIALAAASAPPLHAQQTDPQAHRFRTRLKAKYLERRDRFLHKVKDIYLAVACKVLAREAGILPLTSSESYLAYVAPDHHRHQGRNPAPGGDAGRREPRRKARRVRLFPQA